MRSMLAFSVPIEHDTNHFVYCFVITLYPKKTMHINFVPLCQWNPILDKPDVGCRLFLAIVLCPKIGLHFWRLSINENNDNLEFEWVDYSSNSTFTGDPIASDVDNNFFQSLRKYIDKESDIKSKVSIYYLQLNLLKHVQMYGLTKHLCNDHSVRYVGFHKIRN